MSVPMEVNGGTSLLDGRRGPAPPDTLVDRAEEAGLLAHRARRLAGGQGGVVVLAGEPGSGKSWLVATGRALVVDAGVAALEVTCLPVSESLPMDPIRSLLRQARRLAPPPLPPLPPDARVEVVANSFFDHLEHLAAAAPLLVAIDDLHWASAAARHVLQSAITHLADLPMAWLLAGRPDPSLSALVRQLGRELPVDVRVLGPLGPEAVGQLLAMHLGRPADPEQVARVHARTGGNPLLCVALARTWPGPAGPGPGAGEAPGPAVQAILAEWLDRLDPRVVDALGWAAVLPEPARAPWLEALTGLGPDLAGLAGPGAADLGGRGPPGSAATGLLVPDSRGQWWFRHPVVREAIYGRLSPGERGRRHRRVADLLAGEAPHLLAPQLAGAGDLAGAARAYLEVGEIILARGGGEDATAPFERAVALGSAPAAEGVGGAPGVGVAGSVAAGPGTMAGGPEVVDRARAGLALAWLRAGHVSRAWEVAAPLLEDLARPGREGERLSFLSRFGLALWDEACDLESSRRVLAEAEALLAGGANLGRRERAQATLAQAVVLDRAGEPGRALPFAEEAFRQAQDLGDPLLSLQARNRLGLIVGQTAGPAHAIPLLREVKEAAGRAGMPGEAALALLNLSCLSELAGDTAGLEAYAREGLALPGVPPSLQALLRSNLSLGVMNRGDLDEALAHQLAARAVAVRVGRRAEDRVVVGLVHVHARRGDLGLAERLLEGLSFPPGSAEDRRMKGARAFLLEESGHLPAALGLYEEVAGATDHPGRAWGLAGVVRAAARAGLGARAEWAARGLEELAGRWPAAEWLGQASQGWLAVLSHDPRRAADLFARAADRSPEAFEAARLRLEAARLRSDGPGLVACAQAYEAMGARRGADRARQAARALGVRLSSPRARVGRLTRREHEVALLVASGRRNSEIAGLLYVSERTVERHVSSVLRALGLRSRVELASLAASGRLPG